MTELPIQYLAGVLDARAHIEAHNRHGHVQPRLRVTTKMLRLLNTLAEYTGTKVVPDYRGYTKRPCGEHCTDKHSHVVRQSAQWTVDSSRATIVLYNVVPFMVAQRPEAVLALEAGLQRFPPARGNVDDQMAALGWALPTAVGQ